MFTFHPSIPQNIRGFLAALLGPWINRNKHARFSIETMRYGLITFRRDPWPMYGDVIVVLPAGKHDLAAVQNFSASF